MEALSGMGIELLIILGLWIEMLVSFYPLTHEFTISSTEAHR